jgi:hypothetical protein
MLKESKMEKSLEKAAFLPFFSEKLKKSRKSTKQGAACVEISFCGCYNVQ